MNVAIPITKALNISYIPKYAMLINDNHLLDNLMFLIPEKINTTIYVTIWIEDKPQIILDTLWKQYEKSMKIYEKIIGKITEGYILHGNADDIIDSIERSGNFLKECNVIMNNIKCIYECLASQNKIKEIGNE